MRRTSSTIPFGYVLSEKDSRYLTEVPEELEVLDEIKSLGVPFGFKFNAFERTKTKDGYTANYSKSGGNPNQFLGQRHDLTPKKMSEIAKRFMDKGATILGGCCETRPSHIKEMVQFK